MGMSIELYRISWLAELKRAEDDFIRAPFECRSVEPAGRRIRELREMLDGTGWVPECRICARMKRIGAAIRRRKLEGLELRKTYWCRACGAFVDERREVWRDELHRLEGLLTPEEMGSVSQSTIEHWQSRAAELRQLLGR